MSQHINAIKYLYQKYCSVDGNGDCFMIKCCYETKKSNGYDAYANLLRFFFYLFLKFKRKR